MLLFSLFQTLMILAIVSFCLGFIFLFVETAGELKLSLITKTCPSSVQCIPPKPHFYIANLGYAGVYFFAPKHRLWVLVRTASSCLRDVVA